MKKKILFVYAPAGPPIDFVLPTMEKRADIFTLIAAPSNDYNFQIIAKYSTQIIEGDHSGGGHLSDNIIAAAKKYRVDGIVTFSEFLLETVSLAADSLGLRNAGANVHAARNKIEMRKTWQGAGVPQPVFSEVFDAGDIQQACATIGLPLLLKVANGAGSIGQQIIRSEQDISDCLDSLTSTVENARMSNEHEINDLSGSPKMLAEAIIPGSTESWYEDKQFGDYLSVEGVVRDGIYHPLAMTARLPTIEPFIEVSNLAPCPLSAPKKKKIVELAAKAVDALDLHHCATHTEIKLLANGEAMLIETAARMGGVAIAKEVHSTFGINMVDILLCILLDEPCRIPEFEESPPIIAAASMSLIAANSRGEPWKTARRFDPAAVDWNVLAGDDITVTVEKTQSMAYGNLMPPFYSAGGVLTNAGIAFVTAPDVRRLSQAVKAILDGLENALPQSASGISDDE